MSALLEINDLNFEREVLASNEPFLLDFSGVWCSPCRVLEPILEQLALETQGRLRIGKLDVDGSPEVAARFGVRGAPTLLLFRNGQESARRLGLTNRKGLLELVGL
jgi:thioredoxin 1